MQENLLTKRSHLLSVSIRLGLPLALGTLAVLLLTGLASAVTPGATLAESPRPGDLDTSFGTGGIVTTSIGPGDDLGIDVAIQPDDKIVVAGGGHSGSDLDFAVVRYTVSGTPDTTFGTGGVVTTPIGLHDVALGVAIQEDGRIVAAGTGQQPGFTNDIAVVRYTVSGTLDTTFGTGGVVNTPIGPGTDAAYGVAIQPDGRIVVAGHTYNGSDDDVAIVRYTVSGTLDTTFGTTGIVTTPIGPGTDAAYGVAIQEDGRIVVAGHTYNGSDEDFAVVRYTVSGTLDTTFGTTGIVTIAIGPGHDRAYGVAIQPDGRIVVAGYAHSGSDLDFALVRYTVSGTLDTTFGTTGIVTTPIGPGTDAAYGVAIQPDGRIVVAGYAHSGSDLDFAVVRYTVSGTQDTSFGTGGVVTTAIGPGTDYASGVAIQPDGKIVAAGRAHGGSDYDFAVVRYHGAYSVYLPLVLRNS